MSTPPQGEIPYRPSNDTVSIQYRKRSLDVYPMLDQEVRRLVSGFSSVNLTFFGIAVGAFLATGITWLTVPLSDRMNAAFLAITIVLAFAAVYCAVRARQDWREAKKIVDQVRRETVDAIVQGRTGGD